MEKYRIVGRDAKTKELILESSTGKLERIDESKFMDTFAEVSKKAIKYIKKGKDILVKFGDKLVGGVNTIFDVIKNKNKDTHVFLGGKLGNMCDEMGVKNPNDEFISYLKELDKEDADMVPVLLAKSILAYRDSLNNKKVNEAEDTENKDWADKWGMKPKAQRSLSSKNPSIPDYDALGVTKALIEQANYIFDAEVTETSAMNAAKDAMYKPILIFGESGIGKTQIIEGLVKHYKQYGIDVQMVLKTGQEIQNYALSAPSKSSTTLYKRDSETGKLLRDKDGKLIPLQTRESIKQVMAADMVGFDYEQASLEGNIIDADMGCGYGILFIDEFSRMQFDEEGLVMSLARNRGIGNTKLGTHWMVVMASNPGDMTDSKVKGLSTPQVIMHNLLTDNAMTNSFQFMHYNPNPEDWKEWAKSHEVNEYVIDFITSPETSYHFFNTRDIVPEESGATSNPRLWAELSEYMNYIISHKKNKFETEKNELNLSVIEDAKVFIDKVKERMEKNLPFEKDDFTSYLNDELITLSRNDFKNIWTNPETIMEKGVKSPRRLRNSMINDGRGIPTNTTRIANKIYNAMPIDITKNNVEVFLHKYMKEWLNNVAEFLTYFYGADEMVSYSSSAFAGTEDGRIKVERVTASMSKVPVDFLSSLKTVVKLVTDMLVEDVSEALDRRIDPASALFDGRLLDNINEVPEKYLCLYAFCSK